jgi:hypothetical protein
VFSGSFLLANAMVVAVVSGAGVLFRCGRESEGTVSQGMLSFPILLSRYDDVKGSFLSVQFSVRWTWDWRDLLGTLLLS